jgi:hypothetical protein
MTFLQKLSVAAILVLAMISFALTNLQKGIEATSTVAVDPVIPRTWDSTAMHSFELPLANPKASPRTVSEDYYYRLKERQIFKTYPVYHPDHEPKGYREWLKNQEPEIVFDPAKLKSEADWIAAGQILFDYPIDTLGAIISQSQIDDREFYQYTKMHLTKEGMVPYTRYVITKKGEIRLGNLSCGMCHTRVMNDGSVLKGAQGNFPGDPATAHALQKAPDWVGKFLTNALFAAPWVENDPHGVLASSSMETIIKAYAAVPDGANGRQGTSVLFPPQVPDLIGVKDRKYLDHGGLGRHRDVGDMMRYIAVNQSLDFLNSYDGFIPIAPDGKTLPPPGEAPKGFGADDRYSEEQLYALSMFVYSLKPPPNPNKPSALTGKGEKIFIQQGCVTCHTPPVFTNNKLTPADGFEVPEEHWDKYDIFGISVGTDPNYTLKTRRGTGYYKIPSLKGVWYRGPFFHNAWLATLEDVFNPERLKDDYIPTAFKSSERHAVPGHEFGLSLSEKDKKALIAYLKTL